MRNRFIQLEKSYYWLFFISLYFFAIASWILPPGIPGGVDTNSHLFKVLYLSKFGLLNPWCHEWYAGYPFLLYYPPVSYYLAASLSIAPSALLSFKILSIIFFSITPLSAYYLAKNLSFNKNESILAALLLRLSPVFIMNLLYYGRFPNVVAFPLVCLTLGRFIHSYKKNSSFVIPALLLGSLILIHHLSAFIGFFLLFMFSIFESVYSRNLVIVKLLSLVTLTALAIGAVWIIPFIVNIGYYGNFLNPSAPILSLKVLLRFYISIIGLSHILLSVMLFFLIIYSILPLKKEKIIRIMFAFVFCAIIISYTFYAFLNDEIIVTIKYMLLLLICVTLILFIYIYPQFTKSQFNLDINVIFCFFWFVLFFWLTLGPRAILFAFFPLNRNLDILRFMLYASIPVSLLGARMILYLVTFFKDNYHIISLSNRIVSAFLLTLIIFSFTVPFIQPRYGQGGMLYAEDIFQKNQEIQQQLITYLRDSEAYGRILSIKSPSWVYSLPYYTDKPLLDGWFPQARFLHPFQNLTSYTINDLVPSEEWVYEYLLERASLYGIKWVLIGSEEKLQLLQSHQFHLILNIDSLYLYEANFNVSFIDVKIGHAEITYERPDPDNILIKVTKNAPKIELLVKEVYFPYWQVETTENLVEIKMSEIGFIELSIDSDNMSFEILLFYKYPLWQRIVPFSVSIIAILSCCFVYFKFDLENKL